MILNRNPVRITTGTPNPIIPKNSFLVAKGDPEAFAFMVLASERYDYSPFAPGTEVIIGLWVQLLANDGEFAVLEPFAALAGLRSSMMLAVCSRVCLRKEGSPCHIRLRKFRNTVVPASCVGLSVEGEEGDQRKRPRGWARGNDSHPGRVPDASAPRWDER
jgi:hypothetical protein